MESVATMTPLWSFPGDLLGAHCRDKLFIALQVDESQSEDYSGQFLSCLYIYITTYHKIYYLLLAPSSSVTNLIIQYRYTQELAMILGRGEM